MERIPTTTIDLGQVGRLLHQVVEAAFRFCRLLDVAFHSWFNGVYVRYLVLALGVFSVYWAAGVFTTYGYYDDYWQLYFYQHGKYEFPTSLFYQYGRPIQDLISRPLFVGIDSIEGLRWIRAVNLILLIGFGWYLLLLFERIGSLKSFGLALAFIALMTPASGIYVAWACMVHAPFAMIVSGLAGYACYSAWSNQHLSKTGKWVLSILGLTGVIVAESAYQPGAGAFMLPFIVALCCKPLSFASARLMLMGSLLFALAMGIYFILYKASLELWVGHGWFTGREDSSNGLLANIGFVAGHTIFLLAGFWEVFRAVAVDSADRSFAVLPLSVMVAVAVLGSVWISWLIPIVRNWKEPLVWMKPFLLLIAFGLILAPIIVSGERYLNFRLFGLAYTTLIIFTISGGGIRKMDPKSEQISPNCVFNRNIRICRLPDLGSCPV